MDHRNRFGCHTLTGDLNGSPLRLHCRKSVFSKDSAGATGLSREGLPPLLLPSRQKGDVSPHTSPFFHTGRTTSLAALKRPLNPFPSVRPPSVRSRPWAVHGWKPGPVCAFSSSFAHIVSVVSFVPCRDVHGAPPIVRFLRRATRRWFRGSRTFHGVQAADEV